MDSRKLVFLLLIVAFCEIQEEDGVWVLDEANFKEALSMQTELLVEFYAPWCGHCKKLAPEYSKAAKRLKEQQPPIHIAKIDATVNTNLTEKYEIKNYPTLKYFTSSKPTDFSASKTEDGIVNWILKKTGNSLSIVSDLQTLNTKLGKSKVSVVLFTELNSKEHSLFTIVSKSVDDPSFYVCNDPNAWESYKVKAPAVVVFKQFDDKRVDYQGIFSTQEIINFVEKNKKPWVVKYDENLDEVIFGKNQPCLVLFRHESQAKEFDKILKTISRQLEGKVLVSYTDLSTEENRKLAGNFGLSGKKQPAALILDPANDTRYFLSSDITEDSLKQFLKDWKARKLEPLLKSENISSKTHENHVRIVVAKNFEEVVMDRTKDVLIEFYAPWCKHCKELAPKYEKLGKVTRHVSTLVIAKMDSTANEVRGFKIQGFPTIKFFPANNKKGIEYSGELETEDLLRFVKSRATNKFELDEDL